MSREKIDLRDTTMDVFVKMSEGNPGAMIVISRLCTAPEDFLLVLDLDDMNMRGSQIWVAYKDHCFKDIDNFKTLVRARDQAMVDTVNRNNRVDGEKAVRHGGSYRDSEKVRLF